MPGSIDVAAGIVDKACYWVEPVDKIRERAADWALVVGEERIWLAPSCGFGRHPLRSVPVLRAKVENMVRRHVLVSVTGSCLPQVHKRCTGLASTQDYCSTPERLHGLEPQTTAHSTDWRAPQTHELAVLNLFCSKGRVGSNPTPGTTSQSAVGQCEGSVAGGHVWIDPVGATPLQLEMPPKMTIHRRSLASYRSVRPRRCCRETRYRDASTMACSTDGTASSNVKNSRGVAA